MQVVTNIAAGSLDPGPYTLTPPNGSCYEAEVQADGGDVRYQTNGDAPTASNGFLLTDGNIRTIRQCNRIKFTDFKFIKSSGTVKLAILWSYR